jgi:dihydrodipicolinate synthase/N-acetylneuraminate lyase
MFEKASFVFSFITGAKGCIWGGANYMPHESVRAPLQNLSVDEEHELAACLEPLG